MRRNESNSVDQEMEHHFMAPCLKELDLEKEHHYCFYSDNGGAGWG